MYIIHENEFIKKKHSSHSYKFKCNPIERRDSLIIIIKWVGPKYTTNLGIFLMSTFFFYFHPFRKFKKYIFTLIN